jgi:hypothetical protein
MQDIGRIAFLLCIVHVRYFYHGYRKFCLVKFNFPSLHTLNFPSHRRTLRTWHASYVKFHINLSERILNLQRGVKLNGFVAFVSLLGRCILSVGAAGGYMFTEEATISLVPIHHTSSAGWVNCSGVHLIIQIV